MVEVVVGEAGGPAGLVGGQDLLEGGVDGDAAGLVGLAGHLEAPGPDRSGDRRHAQGDGFSLADARDQEQRDQGQVALGPGFPGRGVDVLYSS